MKLTILLAFALTFLACNSKDNRPMARPATASAAEDNNLTGENNPAVAGNFAARGENKKSAEELLIAVKEVESELETRWGLTFFWGCMTPANYSFKNGIEDFNLVEIINDLYAFAELQDEALSTVEQDHEGRYMLEQRREALADLLNELGVF